MARTSDTQAFLNASYLSRENQADFAFAEQVEAWLLHLCALRRAGAPIPAPGDAGLRALAQHWLSEAEDEPEGSPSESVLLYCANALTAVLAQPIRPAGTEFLRGQLESTANMLEWVRGNYLAALEGEPVRDADECLVSSGVQLHCARTALTQAGRKGATGE